MVNIAIIVAFLAGSAASPLPNGVSEDFKQWVSDYSREYESDEEAMRRFGVFAANRDYVNSHNIQEAAGVHTFKLKLNKFADMTVEEYRQTLLGLRPASRDDATAADFLAIPASDAPASWDWRAKGVVNDVKNQAQCGSCWAFAAVAAMEGAFNYKSNGTVPAVCSSTCGSKKTPCCSFSEQELVDCVNDGKDTCNVGGDPHDGVSEIAKQMKGVFDTEKQYPYTSGGGSSPGKCHAKSGGVQTGISGYTQVTPRGDEKALMLAAWKQPVLAIGIDASQQSFQFYSEGVYVEPKCKNKAEELDHGVSIVGYGSYSGPAPGPSPGPPGPQPGPEDCVNNNDDKSCSAEAGCHWCKDMQFCMSFPCDQQMRALGNGTATPYWIIRNSWGPDWGIDGYILMARNKDNQCGVASDAIFANIGSSDVTSSTLVI